MGESGKQIAIGAMPIRLAEDQREVTFQLADPGIVRSVQWVLEKRLVMAAGAPSFDEVLTAFVEYSPNATKRNRRFLVMETGAVMGVPDGAALVFLGTAVSGNTGRVAHLYEVKAVS